MILNIQERDEIMSSLNDDQRDFLEKQLVRSRRTAFANALAIQKGHHVPENAEPEEIERLLSDWVYAGYIDAGHVSSDLRCECGRPLRYQHHVEHKITKETKKFGIEHLKEHLGIDAAVVAAIKKGFDAIDYELDEILIKISSKWQPNPEILKYPKLPDDVISHLKHGLPLLEKQIKRIRSLQTLTQTPRKALEHPTYTPPIIEQQEPIDLFTWNETKTVSQDIPGPDLAYTLQSPVEAYINSNIKSARIICELLIKEHGAVDTRFLTNKPHIYYAVCRYIEKRFPNIVIQSEGTEDRLYHFID